MNSSPQHKILPSLLLQRNPNEGGQLKIGKNVCILNRLLYQKGKTYQLKRVLVVPKKQFVFLKLS